MRLLLAFGAALALALACSDEEAKPRTRPTTPPKTDGKTSAGAETQAPGAAPGAAPGTAPGTAPEGAAPGTPPGPGVPALPSIAFVKPTAAVTGVHLSFDVEVAFTAVASTATWSLYRTPTQGAKTGGLMLISRVPVATTKATIDTAMQANGTFYVYALLDDDSSVATALPFPITVAHPGAPAVAFVKPTAPAAKVAAVDVELSFANVAADATWSLFAVTSAGATSGGTALEQGVAVATTTKAIAAGGLPAGVYYLYAKVDGTTAVAASPHALSVGNRAPVVASVKVGDFTAATVADKKRAFVHGDSVTITTTASDPDGDAVTYKLEYAANAASPTWILIADGLTADTYGWTVPASPDALTYEVRATASDGEVAGAPALTGVPFGVRSQAVTYATTGDTVKPLLDASCATSGCHDSTTVRSGHDYSSHATATGTPARLARLRQRAIVEGTMPQSGALSASDRNLLQFWLWFQAPP